MDKLSLTAKVYLLGVMAAGGALLLWQLSQLTAADLGLALGVGGLAALAQVFKVEGPTERSSYNLSWVGYGFAFVLLGAPSAVLVIVLSHLAEWLKHRYPWYIQSFNIAQFVVAASAATLARDGVAAHLPAELAEAAAVLVAGLTFTGLNHWLIGAVLKLARGQSFKESGVFERLTLVIDFTLFGMGMAGALLWQVNPFVTFLAAVPLYLLATTLRIPALQRKTQIDPKTGLYNSQYFSQALESELARSERFDRPLTVVMADLDLLRNINNTYGHLAGDACLMAVAGLLKKLVREYDVVARFGGEEFAILMPETTCEQAEPRIEELRAAIEAARIDAATSVAPLQVTMSFGLAGRERFGLTPQDIVHAADLAVYQAKLAGRNRICRHAADETGHVASIPPLAPTTPTPPEPQPVPLSLPAAPASAPASALSPRPQLAAPVLRPRPPWALSLYIAGVGLIAGLASLLLLPTSSLPNGLGLALFVALAILAEGLAIELYVRGTSVSTAAAPMIAAAMLYGPLGALALGLAVAVTAGIKHRSSLNRVLFNIANQVLAGLLSVGVLWLVQFSPGGIDGHLLQIAGAILAGGVMYLSTTALIALAIDLSTGEPFQHVWVERFGWLWPYYLALGALAFVLTFAFEYGGWVTVLATLIPLMMLRYSQSQYLDHTKAMVTDLRAANTELHQHAQEVSTLNEELLMALSQAIDVRDPDVHGHSQEVARYAVLIARQLGLPPERVELVRKAGLLHDIGKLGIPESILFKPARLTDAEYQTVQGHSELGADIVANVHSLKVLVPFVRHHHERFDGQGYPGHLAGHTIPLEARILSVADTVEAMASDRPYRRGLSADAILQEIATQAGSQFDPEVARAFIQAIRREGAATIVNSARAAAEYVPDWPQRRRTAPTPSGPEISGRAS